VPSTVSSGREACALTWRKPDFQAGRISNEAAVTKGKDGSPIMAPPKTVNTNMHVSKDVSDDYAARHVA